MLESRYCFDKVNIDEIEKYDRKINIISDDFEELLQIRDILKKEKKLLACEKNQLESNNLIINELNTKLKSKNKKLTQDIKEKNDQINQLQKQFKKFNDQQIELFNSLPLKMQQILISNIISDEDFNEMNAYFTKINNVFLFLMKNKSLEASHCFEISTDNTNLLSEIHEEYKVNLTYQTTEYLYNTNKISSHDFINLMKQFKLFSIEIKYPSSKFDEISESTSKLVSQFNAKQCNIGAFITGNEVVDFGFNKENTINYARFDSIITNIYCSNSYLHRQSLKKIYFSDLLTEIGDNAFYKCSSLTQISIPNSVIKIGSYAFSECTSLKDVYLPSNLTLIGYSAFYNCTNLLSISIPSSVKDINQYAFMNCTSLKSLFLKSSLYIQAYAFKNCSSLRKVTLPANSTVGFRAFPKHTIVTMQ